MSFTLSVYSQAAFKEYLLPAIDNSDYSLIIEGKLYGLSRDIEIQMAVNDGKWNIQASSAYTLRYSKQNTAYEGEILVDEDVLLLSLPSGDMLSIIVNEAEDAFSVYEKYAITPGFFMSIGKDPSNNICYDNMGLISKVHARISEYNGVLVLEDVSTNGTFLNGLKINGTVQLSFGDCVDIYGLRLVFMGSFLAVNTSLASLSVNDGNLQKYKSPVAAPVLYSNGKQAEKDLFHRAPRNIPKIETEPIEIEAPPSPKELIQQPTFLAIGPSLTMALPMVMGCMLSIYARNLNGGSGNNLFMYTGLVTAIGSSLIGVVWSIVNMRHARNKNRSEENKRFEAYSEYLIETANNVKEKYENNAKALQELYPDTAFVANYDRNSLGLWNRNVRHEDFLCQRLGIGAVPFQVDIAIPKERFKLINDSLAEKPKLIRESYRYLQNVPVTIDLNVHKMVGIIGGEERLGCYQVMYNLATQIAANNCYTDVKMVFIYDETKDANASIWNFARWLPHVWSEDKKTRYVAGNKQDASEVFYEITKVLRMRSEDRDNYSKKDAFPRPYYVLFLENPALLEGELISKYIFDTEDNVGISTVVMVNSYEELPNACEYIIENSSQYQGVYDVTDGFDDRIAVAFDFITDEQLEKFSRRLAAIEVKEEETSGEIPTAISFFDMYGVNHPEELGVVDRWKKNRTYESMKALVGQKAGGANCYLDVHEKYHGPHGLVAGTTGSGKSETLQTYMLSLALNFSPDDIGFFIIDYKGGGMANLFDGLPHMIGAISNLSGNQVRRAMVSIKSENRRRQQIFNEHGVNNINLYTRLYKNNEATIPVPHMFIIIDEFAELKREEPDFMRELVSVAQVGRSLGVHLILATQKPSGTVDDNIWSNSKFKLCLRVQDRQDSNDMLHKPDAAYITQSGRCYLQVGNDELYELFQSGWSGATYDKSAGTIQTNIAQMISLNGRAALVGSHAKIKQKELAREKWIASLLEIIDKAAEVHGNSVVECASDDVLCANVTKEVFRIIEAMDIDYPETDFNTHRIEDLVEIYGSIMVDPNAAAHGSLASQVIALSALTSKKLPEVKEKTQLDAVIEHLAEVADSGNFNHNLKLWLPVLPTELYLDQLSGYTAGSFDGTKWPATSKEYTLETIVGLYDDPENQAQKPITIDIAADGNHAIVGTVVTGKSTFLMTYLYSLINRYAPDAVNVYILDYSSKMLGALAGAPHVGGVMFEDDDEKVSKFFTMLSKILAERKKLFKGGSYSQYIQANGLVLPSIVVAIDNMASFRAKTDCRYDDLMMTLLKEGLNYGIFFIVTAAGFSMAEIPNRMGENFRGTLCLEMNDKFAYSDILRTLHIDVQPEENVKGRGIAKIGDSILEYQTALTVRAEDDYKRQEAITLQCEKLSAAWQGKLARPIPEIPEKPVWSEYARLDEAELLAKDGYHMPVGYDKRDASIYGIDLSRTYCYTVSGRSRTGKTNYLRVAIKSAQLVGGDITVIDFSGELESVATSVGATYVNSVETLYKFFTDLTPKFVERNKAKKAYDSEGISSDEIYDKMQSFDKMFIFVWDLPEFILTAANPGEGYEPMSRFLDNIISKGSLHNVFWFAAFNQDDKNKVLAEDVYKSFLKYQDGIHFGGKAEDVQYMSFDYLSFTQKAMPQKVGTGWLPTHDQDNTAAVVIPLYKNE